MSEARPKKTLWAWTVGTFFGAGLLRPGPGTWGSAAAALLWLGAGTGLHWARVPLAWATLAAALCAVAIGIPAATKVERESGREDPGHVVIDEVAGQWIALIYSQVNLRHMLAGFLFFRLLDIVKPWPARQLESLHEGWGIMLDDVAAGVYALLLMLALQRWIGSRVPVCIEQINHQLSGTQTMRFSKDPPIPNSPRIEAAVPDAALPGGEIEVRGTHLGALRSHLPTAVLDGLMVPVLLSRNNRMIVRVPEEVHAGRLEIRQDGQSSNTVQLKIARLVTGNLHPVSNPAVDAEGNIYSTDSGPRGQKTPVSVYRITPAGEMYPLVSGITNATGLALDAEGYLYVSSRLDGTVHRVSPEGASSVYAEGMGIATGIAFDAAGNLYVGDRSGTIFKIAKDRQIFVFATLEPSIAAYHLAFGLDGTLFVTAPSTSSYDSIYAIDQAGVVRVYYRGLGRPQGLAFDVAGNVYVSASLHGNRGIVCIAPSGDASVILAGSGIVGLAFVPGGNAILAANGAVYDVALGIEGVRLC